MAYSTLWTVIGLTLLLVVAGWYVVVWWRTRPVPPPPPAPALASGARLDRLKGACLARIDELVRRVEAGQLSQRGGHQELSTVVREFVQEATGVSAPTMTLTELGRSGNRSLDPVTDVVLLLYPVEFGPEQPASVTQVAVVARRVVERWS
ncbi:MAG: hypothetical protein M3Y71_12320 [Actinomycetota bacterium]|nr:hypothetical protein [Actinomycetota bacterium]